MRKQFLKVVMVSLIIGTLTACGGSSPQNGNPSASKSQKNIIIDGSSTVFPISQAMAEDFKGENTDVNLQVAESGTGGGMKKFSKKEIDICDASRPIKKEEIEECTKNNVQYTEFTVGHDGISIITNKNNTWADSLTVEDLKKLWEPDSKVKTWKDLNPKWPNEAIKLYGPGTASGTFDYFTETIMKKVGAIRKDYVPSEDDNLILNGVESDKNALGFLGYAYYFENKDKLKVVKIDGGKGPIEPNFETIKSGTYAPLSRPLFVYVNNASLEKTYVKDFMKYYLVNATEVLDTVGYVPLEKAKYQVELAKIK